MTTKCLKTRTAHSICREWRQVHLKAQYEMSMLDERDEEGVDRVVSVAEATKVELESDLADASMTTGDDVASVLGIALCLLEENTDHDRASDLIRLARKAAYGLGDATLRSAA
jgi:hypothetical protein